MARWRRRRWVPRAVAAATVLVLAGGSYAAVATGFVRVSRGASPAVGATASPALSPPASPPASARPTAPAPAPASPAAPTLPGFALLPGPVGPVLAARTGGRLPTTAGLSAALAAVRAGPGAAKALGPHVGVSVRDLSTGRLLLDRHGTDAFTPASVTKLLTTTAALELLGPRHRFTTSVVQGTSPHRIVLVGGGDPLLSTAATLARDKKDGIAVYPTPATVDQLAARTAAALRAAGVHEVRLRYDASLFSQPISPTWPREYIATNVVSPVSSLWIDEGRAAAPWGARVADPPKAAATAFAAALAAAGVEVDGPPAPGTAAPGAHRLAAVASPPLAAIVEHILKTSDNDGAGVLGRHVALATGRPATFAGATAGVLSEVARLGVDVHGARLFDTSGLSRLDRLSPDLLTSLLAVASSPAHPELSAVLSGLPDAGFDGTLAGRFRVTAPAAMGIVRAKTGLLTGVYSLAGITTTREGRVLAFALMVDQVPTRPAQDPRPTLDRLAGALTACGCR